MESQFDFDDNSETYVQMEDGSLHVATIRPLVGNTLALRTSRQPTASTQPTVLTQSTALTEPTALIEPTASTERTARTASREYWSDDDIKCLLAVFKIKKHLFDSNSIKNEDIWNTIAMEMEAHGVFKTSLQIKNKINNMKKSYKKAKDNNNSTGASPANFKYMEWFDEVFGRDHDITPISYAESSSNQSITVPLPLPSPSTSRPDSALTSPAAESEDSNSLPVIRQRKRRTNSENFMTYLRDSHEERKKYRKQRDEDKNKENQEKRKILKEGIEVMKESNTIFKEMLNKIIDKL